jgi:hypothetical protein
VGIFVLWLRVCRFPDSRFTARTLVRRNRRPPAAQHVINPLLTLFLVMCSFRITCRRFRGADMDLLLNAIVIFRHA